MDDKPEPTPAEIAAFVCQTKYGGAPVAYRSGKFGTLVLRVPTAAEKEAHRLKKAEAKANRQTSEQEKK